MHFILLPRHKKCETEKTLYCRPTKVAATAAPYFFSTKPQKVLSRKLYSEPDIKAIAIKIIHSPPTSRLLFFINIESESRFRYLHTLPWLVRCYIRPARYLSQIAAIATRRSLRLSAGNHLHEQTSMHVDQYRSRLVYEQTAIADNRKCWQQRCGCECSAFLLDLKLAVAPHCQK